MTFETGVHGEESTNPRLITCLNDIKIANDEMVEFGSPAKPETFSPPIAAVLKNPRARLFIGAIRRAHELAREHGLEKPGEAEFLNAFAVAEKNNPGSITKVLETLKRSLLK